MARINDLLRQLESKDSALADEISREVRALSERRAFGLNFERHTPEQAELPGRSVRRGDKVHILPPRGEFPRKENKRIWLVDSISPKKKVANLIAQNDPDHTNEVAIEDLVVVAEFRDPTYPGLVSTGKVERGADKPFHTVINGENFHALQALLFTHRGKVDAIYIDPPYNTGARDWKYNNDYVESEDIYRHSKWLAFMERRLLLAKELLNPEDSVLIVTIDEKEYLRLGLLLEQCFPESKVQMVSTVMNPSGAARSGAFRRTDEYVFFVYVGDSSPKELALGTEWRVTRDARAERLRWDGLIRSGSNTRRSDSANQFYPIFAELVSGVAKITGIGDSYFGDRHEFKDVPPNSVAIWPIRQDGTEGNWQVGPRNARTLLNLGYLKLGKWRAERTTVSYIKRGGQQKISSGIFTIVGRDEAGSVIVNDDGYQSRFIPGTQWRIPSHSAEQGGTKLLANFLPTRKFPFPKSLFAVEDTLRFFLISKPHALALDFFSGSGTTAHAIMRLNRQDGGRRQSISVTNNEVGADEQKSLVGRGLRPGDPDWEQWGICEYITKPRIRASITGDSPDGEPIKGDYKVTDEFPMADGFEENAEFFTLTYESPLQVISGRAFEQIAPLLWMRAGSIGRRIESIHDGWEVANSYGVLTDLDKSEEFVAAISKSAAVTHAFIFTDEDRLFEMVTRRIPEHVEVVRMNDAYVRNAEIEAPAVAL